MIQKTLCLLALAGTPLPAGACSLALALTVDVSASISPTEYSLQMNGLADALEDPEVMHAFVSSDAVVSLVQWTGAGRQQVSLPWRTIESEADLAEFSATVRATPRAWSVFSTAIGEALLFTGTTFDAVSHCERYVIDVSGDGLSNEGQDVRVARDLVVSSGVTINGLAIETSIRFLSRYYESHVVGGPGAFVETAANYDDYGRAIRRKLLAEIVQPAF
ncbi:MAG: DUF1194 domain-containing protein [Pseudomonadota bacterium]